MAAGREPRPRPEPPEPEPRPEPEPGPPLAVGWATVEADRAASELAGLLRPGSTFEPAADSVHLGARCRLGRVDATRFAETRGAGWVVLLEPSTEGRLAASLARHGEGWCAAWTDITAQADDGGSDGPDASHPLSAVREGPLGPERLVLSGAVYGPHRLLVVAATIDR